MSQDPHQSPQRPDDQGSNPPPGQYPQGGSYPQGGPDPQGPPSYPTGSQYGSSPYPPPPPGYGGAPQQQKKNGMGIAALVLGILSLALVIFGGFPGVILGVLAIIFGAVGMSRAKKGRATNRGMAIAGLVLGVLGAIIGAVILFYAIRIAADCSDAVGPNASQAELDACIEDRVGG